MWGASVQMHRKSRARSPFALAVAAFVLVCAVAGGFCFQYYSQLQETIREESSGYLQEISARIGENIDQIIADNYAFLNTFVSGLVAAGADTFSEVRALVDEQRSDWEFEDVIFIDADGKAYGSDGKPVKLDNDVRFIEAVVGKRPVMSNAQMIDNEERIALSIPLDAFSIDGIEMVAAAAVFDPATFDETLSMTAFDGQAFSCIVETGGTVVVRPSSQIGLEMGYNVFSTIERAGLDADSSMDAVKSDIAENLSGQIGFSQNGVRYYVVYTPISPENWYLLTFVPASTVNAKSDMMLQATWVICGGITTVFGALAAVLLFTSSRNRRRLEQIAYVDDVTGGNTITKFYELAQETLSAHGHQRYALVYTNLEKFKVLNEQFGRSAGNDLLKAFYGIIERGLREGEHIGRQSADNFCFLIAYEGEDALPARLSEWYGYAEEHMRRSNPAWTLPIAEFGIYVIENDEIPFPQMIDRAKLALKESPKAIGSKVRYAVYDDEVRRLLFREKQLEDMMEHAMDTGEFRVYLQPKYRLSDGRIGGAEALTRWVSASEGMIFPDEFIPLFEKNGFIVQLDLWIFEEICRLLRTWIDKGIEPMRISVNCSRVHLHDPRFLDEYCGIARRFSIPDGLIEIELTESIVMEDSQFLIKVIENIHACGFECSIDDFGSGYSSLNMIQSIPADTLKLDKIFFRDRTRDPARTKSVVGSIVGMAKALSMETVAEGVEHEDQVEMLRQVGCENIQGYVFARPMPIEDFERLAFGFDEEVGNAAGSR